MRILPIRDAKAFAGLLELQKRQVVFDRAVPFATDYFHTAGLGRGHSNR